MKSLSYARTLAAATGTLVVAALALPAAPAFADHDPRHTQIQQRQAACDALPGESTFTEGAAPGGDRCVTVVVTEVTGPFGAPTTTDSEPRPTELSPIYVDGPPRPAGEPTTDEEYQNVGDPVVVRTLRVGDPEITSVDRDAGAPLVVPVIVPGQPMTETRTEEGTPTSTTAPGVRNCEPVSQGKDARSGKGKSKDKGKDKNPPVEKCERTVVTTTTTPTTDVTTVTTPQERVTTTTQPRETVTTTRTPSTEVFTSTQARQLCVTTTQQTEFTRTTTQTMEMTRTVTYRQRTLTTTTTSTYRFQGNTAVPVPVVFPGGAPNPRVQGPVTTPADPLVVSVTTVAAPSVETTDDLPGDPIVTGPICAPADAVVTQRDGETSYTSVDTTTPTASVITVQREDIEPLVVVTRTPGEPVVTVTEVGTGDYCVNNPSNSKHGKNASSNSQQCDNDPFMPKPGKADDTSKHGKADDKSKHGKGDDKSKHGKGDDTSKSKSGSHRR